ALLHDVGHFTSPLGKACYEDGLDNNHEAWGAEHLSTHFPPSVTEPIRLHVEAKRYLCAVDAKYFSRLSPQSVLTLGLQGGKMSISEVAEFQVNPHKTGALFLRRCDEAAKAQSVKLKRFADYKPLLKDLLLH
ncbi:MAG: phosphodiesterase, partial [Rhodospirillaceae bacterium]